MPHYSPISNPVLVVPGTARMREDGRLEIEIVGIGRPSFVLKSARGGYVCSITGIPQEAGTSLLEPFAKQPALEGVCISPDGWVRLQRSPDALPLMMWPQNRSIHPTG